MKSLHLILIFALLFTVGAQAIQPPALASDVAYLAPAQQGEAAPVLLDSAPANGAAWDGGPVTFTFDQPMASAQIDVTPALEGETTAEGAQVVFTSTTSPAANTRYRFSFAEATAAGGAAIASPLEITLQSTGPLGVASTQPLDGAQDVDANNPITVIFNRPVVPLTGVDEQASLPQPLDFDPFFEGQGQWISTSVYQFVPAVPLAAATTFNVTVAPMTAIDGSAMSEPYTFSFTTSAPIVLGAKPAGILVPPDEPVVVTFSQPMDRASTQDAFSLWNEAVPSVEGFFAWNDAGTVMTFTAASPLPFGDPFAIDVADTAQAASQQGTLREAWSSTFTVSPLPAIDQTSILPDAQGVNPENELRVRFTAPVSETMLFDAITIETVVTNTQVVSYTYTDLYDLTNGAMDQVQTQPPFGYATHLMLNWYKQPNTTYTVTIGSNVADPYGNTLPEDFVMSFTTGDYPPLLQIDLSRFTHYTAYTNTVVGVNYRNVATINAKLYRVPLNDLFQLAGENQWSVWDAYVVPDQAQNLLWERNYTPEGEPNVIQTQGMRLTAVQSSGGAEEPLPPGVYMLEVRDPAATAQQDGRSSVQRAVIILSNNNITFKRAAQGQSLAWLTDLATGQPVADAPVTFTRTGPEIAQAATDSDGVAMADLGLTAQDQWAPYFAYTGQPGDAGFAVVSSDWAEGIQPWMFNLNTGGSYDQILMNLYTERPIYRPGQPVYWKGIIRVLQNDEWTLPVAGQEVIIKINDGMGNLVYTGNYPINENGTINGEFMLAPDALTGYYSLNADVPRDSEAYYSASGYFQVAAYRKPEFQIAVTTDQPEYIQGETVTVTVQADYFSGGPLANAPVEWRITGYSYTFNWADAPAGRYYSFDPFDPEQPTYNPYDAYQGLVQEGRGTTDATGAFTFEVPADLGSTIASQNWTLDVTITDPSNQAVYSTSSFPVHRGEFYIGLSPTSYVVEAGSPATVDAVTVRPDGTMYAGAELEVAVYEYVWSSVYEQAEDGNYYWKSSAERTPVHFTSVTTNDSGMATIDFTPEKGGQYQVTATGEDALGNVIRSATFVYAASAGEYVAWPQNNNDRIELVADKKLYAPGETAKILVPNPFTGPVKALVTLERSGVLEERVVEFTGSSETIDVPVTAAHIPNIFVGVVIVKGVDETNPFAATRVGYVKLAVDTAQKELTIDVQPSAETVRPGDTVTYTLTVRDSDGNPVAGAETSLALVDKAVLVLAGAYGTQQSLVDVFYYERPLGVNTGSLIVINKDRVSQQLTEGGKGGGGGGGDGGPEVREDLADTAYWRADAVSDENGVIEFSVTLPDNLTTWTLTAKAVTPDTRVGEAVNDIVATKELQVRPTLPRFFTAGDRAIIGGIALNGSKEAIEGGTFALEISGAEIEGRGARGEESFDELDPGAFAQFGFPIAVDSTASTVVVTMTAVAGDLSDGIRMEIPVVRYQTPETVGTSGVVPAGGVTEAIYVPQSATDDGELSVTLDPSLGAGMLEGLGFLEHYPYECNEQTVSRFLPNLFTVRALNELNISDPALESQLSYQLGIGVQQLISRQNPDGGWGYWPQQESTPFITAYVLWGLNSADALGYPVSMDNRNRAADYLSNTFVAPADVTNDWQLNEMAFIHYVLAGMGRGDTGRVSTLYDLRERLAYYGQAFLAMAMYEMDATDPRVQTLMDDLAGAANLTAAGASWSEATVDYTLLGSDTRSTAIVLGAFTQIRPDEAILPNVVRWLMSARTAGRWATTQENAWSIIALTDWMKQTGELEADYAWQATLNDAELGSGAFDSTTIMDSTTLRAAITDLLRDQANYLRINRDNESGQLYYTTYLTYNLDALAVEPLDRGMVVDRRFATAAGPVSSAAVGDIISVTVTIVAPTDLYHLMVETPIPAGTEPVDPNLSAVTPDFMYGPPELKPVNAGQGGWYGWTPSFTDYRDDKVTLFATWLPSGTYEYTFQVRASLPGEFRVLPVHGEMMYFPEVWGRSGGELFTVNK
ncbi:MAG: MG2 domain-containing protein [Caldilinea sp.]|nr:MG2 domain-containing protein [Caldilinea sp.]